MAIRARAVYPDEGYVLPSGETIAIVSEEEFIGAVVKAASAAYLHGGILQVMQERARTGVPNEMVTVGALIQWQDRTDAKAQPEPATAPTPLPDPPDEELPDFAPQFDLVRNERTGEVFELRDGVAVPVEGDGIVDFPGDPEPDELEAQLEAQAREPNGHVPIPAEAVVVGAPVGAAVGPQGYETPRVTETRLDDHSEIRTPRERGAGAGALPFQKGDQPGDPPRPVDQVNLDEIAHGDTSAPSRGAEPAPAGHVGIDDGLRVEADEDLDAIPEHLR